VKRTLVLILLLAVGLIACGQSPTHYATTATLAWDAPAGKTGGVPFAAGDVVEYELARWTAPVDNRAAPDEIVGVTAALSLGVTVPAGEAAHVYGVRTRLTTDGGVTVLYSDYIYSDVGGSPAPWVLRRPSTATPLPPLMLRIR